ncbi:MAG: GTPase [Polaromonas sp.]
MKSEISIVSGILVDGLPLLTKHVGEAPAQELVSFVARRASDATPVVMVFGIYNAGKSTLLNALIGEERAAVADRPETSVVTSYEWNGFKLLDTPGIDAPAEHERVSREQLSESDVVLFILSTNGSFDEKSIYDELINIVVAEKPVMVIVNNKDSYSESDINYRVIYEKIVSNIDAAGHAKGLSDLSKKVSVRLVNAELALKGKLSNKHNLIAASGLPALARDIETMLRQTGAHEVAATLRQRVLRLIDAALAKLNSMETHIDARLITEHQTVVRGEKERVLAAVTSAVRRAAVGFSSAFHFAVEARDESAMQAAMQAAVTATTQAMEREITAAGATLSALGASLADIESIRVATDATARQFKSRASHENQKQGESQADSFILDNMKNFASKVGKESAEKATQAATKAALQLTKEWIPSLMKGTGAKTIEKMAGNAGRFAGKAAPFIGPVIDTVRGIYDYYQETKKQEEYLQAMQRQARALADHVDQTTENLQAELIDACRVVVMPVFLPIEKALADQANGLAREHQSFVADRQSLDVLKLRLENAVNTH